MTPSRRWRLAAPLLALACATLPLRAQDQPDDKFARRAERAAEVLGELVRVPDSAPPDALLRKAECVAVVPGVVQAGLGIGGRVGFGLASCRTASGWSQPSFVGLKGGSIGLQIGGQAADIVLVFLNPNAQRTLSRSTFTLGGNASVAAGPVGRNLAAETDYKAQAEILAWSRSRGLFAGVTLSGTRFHIDGNANRKVYGAALDAHATARDTQGVAWLLTSAGSGAPATVQAFVAALAKHVGPGTR